MPKLIQYAMKADADSVIDAAGKNEQIKKVFWTLFVAMSGLVLARVVDPVTAQQVVGIITGMGCKQETGQFLSWCGICGSPVHACP
jgi:hypothetical protein